LEMLEHIISQTPARVFQDEDVGDCVRAVLELCNCSAGAGYPALETQMVGALVCRGGIHFLCHEHADVHSCRHFRVAR
jgi:hypothetical protein